MVNGKPYGSGFTGSAAPEQGALAAAGQPGYPRLDRPQAELESPAHWRRGLGARAVVARRPPWVRSRRERACARCRGGSPPVNVTSPDGSRRQGGLGSPADRGSVQSPSRSRQFAPTVPATSRARSTIRGLFSTGGYDLVVAVCSGVLANFIRCRIVSPVGGDFLMENGGSLWRSRRAASLLVALTLIVDSQSFAAAATSGGHGALALSAIVGQYDPGLTSGVKAGLLRLLADQAFGGTRSGKLIVKADRVTCRAGNVDIKGFDCTLAFGTRTVTLKGQQAAELYATLTEADVPNDGAAGTSYEGLKALSCTLDLTALGGPGMGDGSGASCDYQPGH